jgi:hypothetical protein
MATASVIGSCPRDGRHWECQCARCGSSLGFEDCSQCDGDGFIGHDCGEDSCFCRLPQDNIPCNWCAGTGGYGVCISGEDWCQAHPMSGREETKRGTVEWFTFDTEPTRSAIEGVP